tara:strand:+ start:35573 stop:35833 length:261 start_codon:yes stop_codon:yes gene_type:complete
MIEGHQLDIREIYEASRLGAYLSMLPHLSKADQRSLTPQKLIKFGWEMEEVKDEKAYQINKDHFKKLGDLYRSGKLTPKYNGKSKN